MSDMNVTKVTISEQLVKQIKAEIGESIGKLECEGGADGNTIDPNELEFAEVNVITPLSGNRAVVAIDEGARVISSAEISKVPLKIETVIPACFIWANGSCYIGSSVGGASTWIKCRP